MLLQMRDIVKNFNAIKILKSVSFSLESGQIHAVVGHNGAGKSTLMKVLGGLYPDYGGHIEIAGQRVHLNSPAVAQACGIAAIYQDFSLVPTLSVAANIALGREPKSRMPLWLDHGALRARSLREAELLGVDLPMDVLVRDLGVATQQMTEIVRALSQNARILIMDEPTARLAPAERAHLFAVMRRMTREGMGIIYISHFLEEVIDLADHITVLRDGYVVSSDKTAHFSVDTLARMLVGETGQSHSQHMSAISLKYGKGTGKQGKDVHDAPPVLVLDDFVAGHGDKARLADKSQLKIHAGEIVGLAGLVGSGRTRLARAIIGDVASQGSLKIDNRNIRPMTPQKAVRHGVILLPEDRKVNGLVSTGTIQENIQLTALGKYLSKFGFSRLKACREMAQQALAHFHIKPAQLTRNVTTLSGGNAQKVLLARAVSARPRVLILDQPTAGVDIGAKGELHKQIRSQADAGVAILLISDDLDELLDLSDRIVVMTSGAVRESSQEQVFDRAGLLAAISRHDEAEMPLSSS